MTPFISEIIGTAILILLGGGVCANVAFDKTAGNNSGWIVITTCYAWIPVFAPLTGGVLVALLSLGLAV